MEDEEWAPLLPQRRGARGARRGPDTAVEVDLGQIDNAQRSWTPAWVSDVSWKRYLVPATATGLLFFATANSVLFKKMVSKAPNYPFFLMQISTAVYVPLCFAVVQLLLASSKIERQAMNAPKYKFAVIALLDGLTSVFTLFGGVYTAGTTQMLLMQGAIPITMILSVVILKTKVGFVQFVGATVIIAGVFVVMSPKIFHASHGTYIADRSGDIFIFNVIFFLGNVPAGLGNVYKEAAFRQHQNLDIWFVMMWTATFQTPLQWMLLPFNSLSFLGEQAVPVDELLTAVSNGARCFGGIDTVVQNCYWSDPVPGLQPCDNCQGSWVIILQYLIANIGFNMLSVLLIKEGSAALYIIIMTLRLPLGNMAFYLPWIMGEDAQQFNPHDLSGLVVILLGLVIYRIERAPDSPEADAPFVVTSIVTFPPGISEPVVNQIHRRAVTIKRSSSHLRGHLYARLGMPPSPSYKEPEREPIRRASAPVPVDDEEYDMVQDRRQADIYEAKPPTPSTHRRFAFAHTPSAYSDSAVIGVSPVARSAPLYSAVSGRRRDAEFGGSALDREESTSESDSEVELA